MNKKAQCSIPPDWVVADLPDVVFFQEGPGLRKYQYRERGIPFLNIRTFVNEQIDKRLCKFLDPEEVEAKYQHFLADTGDILVAISGSIGKMATVKADDLPLMLNTSIMRFRPHDPNLLTDRFLYYFLKSDDFIGQAWSASTGTAQKNVGPSHIKNFTISLPPLPEQKRIVAKLDSLTARSKRARKELDAAPRLVARYKQAVLAAAFSGDLTADWRAASSTNLSVKNILAGVERARQKRWSELRNSGLLRGTYKKPRDPEWSPEIDVPDSWQLIAVDQVTSLIQYGSSSKTDNDEDGVPVLRMGNIQDGKLDWDSLKFLPETHSEFPALLLRDGDVLFNRTNSAELVGKSAVYRDVGRKSSFASYLIRMEAVGFKPELLAHYINSSIGRDWILSVVSQQVGQANVNGSKLRALGIPFMPPDEQDEIVRRIENAFTAINRLAAEHQQAFSLLDKLDQSILAKAFRGELVPQDPSDEPASALLECIRAERAASAKPKRRRRKARAS